MNLTTAIEKLSDDIPTTVLLFFMTTPREKFIKEVIERVKAKVSDPKPSRMYLFFQEGVSEKKSRGIWKECANRAASEVDLEAASSLNIHSFWNVPTEIMQVFVQETDALEVV